MRLENGCRSGRPRRDSHSRTLHLPCSVKTGKMTLQITQRPDSNVNLGHRRSANRPAGVLLHTLPSGHPPWTSTTRRQVSQGLCSASLGRLVLQGAIATCRTAKMLLCGMYEADIATGGQYCRDQTCRRSSILRYCLAVQRVRYVIQLSWRTAFSHLAKDQLSHIILYMQMCLPKRDPDTLPCMSSL
jgi:hypothetical protein